MSISKNRDSGWRRRGGGVREGYDRKQPYCISAGF